MSYKLYTEEDGHGGIFVHCDVYHWTKSVKRELQKEWRELQEELFPRPIFALHRPSEHKSPSKHLKFLHLFQFEWLADIKLVDGSDAILFVKEQVNAKD